MLTETRCPIRTHPFLDRRAWQASTLDDRKAWYHPLSDRCLAAFDETIRQLRRDPRPTTELRVSETTCASCQEDFQPILTILEEGRGFVIIEGMPYWRYSVVEQQIIYWLVGQLLGQPFIQNVQGTLLYDVRDTGRDVCDGARFSITNADTGFHTDNSFGETVADYVGLLCIRSAKSGGENQLVNAYSAYNVLLAEHSDVLETLHQPFHVDRRGGLRPGDAPTSQFPIFQWDGRELLCRYLRHWIEAGHQKSGQPLTAAQKEALDVFDRVLGDPRLGIDLTLQPGEMFFINNRSLLHKRNAFEDYPQPDLRRHYIRLWLQR